MRAEPRLVQVLAACVDDHSMRVLVACIDDQGSGMPLPVTGRTTGLMANNMIVALSSCLCCLDQRFCGLFWAQVWEKKLPRLGQAY